MRHLALLTLLLSACAGPHRAARERTGVPDLEPGELLRPTGGRVALRDLPRVAENVRFVVVGEHHDAACDHLVQAAVIRALPGSLVGLEMVSTDRQPVLDRFHRGELDLAGLERELDWKSTWGVPFWLYAPVFEAAREVKAPLVALNLPKELVRKVAEHGLFVDPRLPPEILPPPEEQLAELEASFRTHAAHGHGKSADVDRFVQVQSLWDTQMARAAIAASERTGRPVVILAGTGHVKNGWGIPFRLQVLAPGDERLTIVPWRGEEPLPAEIADLLAYCPE